MKVSEEALRDAIIDYKGNVEDISKELGITSIGVYKRIRKNKDLQKLKLEMNFSLGARRAANSLAKTIPRPTVEVIHPSDQGGIRERTHDSEWYEQLLTEAEDKIKSLVNKGDASAVFFTLKTLGKIKWEEKHIVDEEKKQVKIIFKLREGER